jgi:hypothetical protein
MYVPSRLTLASTASKMCFRERPTRFTMGPSLVDTVEIGGWPPVVSTPKNTLDRMTTLERGISKTLNAFPTICSDFPLLYVSA